MHGLPSFSDQILVQFTYSFTEVLGLLWHKKYLSRLLERECNSGLALHASPLMLTFLALCIRKIAMCKYSWPTMSWPKMVFCPTTWRCDLRLWSNLQRKSNMCETYIKMTTLKLEQNLPMRGSDVLFPLWSSSEGIAPTKQTKPLLCTVHASD